MNNSESNSSNSNSNSITVVVVIVITTVAIIDINTVIKPVVTITHAVILILPHKESYEIREKYDHLLSSSFSLSLSLSSSPLSLPHYLPNKNKKLYFY